MLPNCLSARRNGAADVQAELLEFSRSVSGWQTPSEVLDALHHVTGCMSPHLSVLGAADSYISIAVALLLLHKDVPDGWWDEYVALAPIHFAPRLFLARSSLASFTWTEPCACSNPLASTDGRTS